VYHSYLPYYDELFASYRHKEINIFEVGYFHGGSAILWSKYFSKAQIRFIDVDSCVPLLDIDRVTVELMSIRDTDESYFRDFPLDIAIDDGSHLLEDQLYFVKTIYPVLREGGILVVEDIANIDTQRVAFDALGIPYEIVDLRHNIGRYDDVLLIYRK